MPEQMITIVGARQWPDGNISVKDHTERYLRPGKGCQPDPVQMLNMEGQAIIADVNPWTNPNSGKTTYFINGWRPADGRQPAAQPQAPQPPAQAPLHVPPPPPRDDRQNSIIAQTLCKTVTFASVQDALAGYQWLLEALSGEIVVDTAGIVDEQVMGAIMDVRPDPVAHQGEPAFDDDLPF